MSYHIRAKIDLYPIPPKDIIMKLCTCTKCKCLEVDQCFLVKFCDCCITEDFDEPQITLGDMLP